MVRNQNDENVAAGEAMVESSATAKASQARKLRDTVPILRGSPPISPNEGRGVAATCCCAGDNYLTIRRAQKIASDFVDAVAWRYDISWIVDPGRY